MASPVGVMTSQCPGEQYSTPWLPLAIPWHLWAPCTNPLLLAAMTRAGFTRSPVREASYQHCVGAIWDSIDSRTRCGAGYLFVESTQYLILGL